MKIKEISLLKHITRKGAFMRIPMDPLKKDLFSEIALGRSILDRAIMDSLEDSEILKWVDQDDEDFMAICFIADLEPEDVVRRFKKLHYNLKQGKTTVNVLEDLYEQ